MFDSKEEVEEVSEINDNDEPPLLTNRDSFQNCSSVESSRSKTSAESTDRFKVVVADGEGSRSIAEDIEIAETDVSDLQEAEKEEEEDALTPSPAKHHLEININLKIRNLMKNSKSSSESSSSDESESPLSRQDLKKSLHVNNFHNCKFLKMKQC